MNIGTCLQWFAEKLQFAIKMESKSASGTTATEYRNIQEGPQPDSLFEIPPGYQKFVFPSAGGLFGTK